MDVMNLLSLENRIALVTGGAGIYGTHISTALAEAGATVIIASRSVDKCQDFASTLRDKGFNARGMELDLEDESSVRRLKDRIVDEYNGVDILVNNAVARAGGDMDHMTPDEWEMPMKVNSRGLFMACKIFGEQMKQQKKGSIINIASIYGIVGPDLSIYEGTELQNPANYSFVKGGMINFTRYLACFYAKYGIRVNCISPGGFQTEDSDPEFVANYNKRVPLGRMAKDDDIKGAVVFLSSDASDYVTGHNLVVDGGWTAH